MKRKKRPVRVKVRNKNQRSYKPHSILKIILTLIVVFVVGATIFKTTKFIISKYNTFPKLEISLNDVTIEQIDIGSKDTKYPNNTATLTSNNESTTYDNVEIKGRGNSTWLQPKKPYQIKFSEKASVFNHGEAKKWILLANYLDGSHLRNDTAFKIASIISNNFTANGDFIELSIDDTYRGLYYLTEKIEIDKSRINLSDPLGALIELDLHNSSGENYIYFKNNAILYIKDMVNQDNYDSIKSEIINSFQQLETATNKKDYQSIQKIIDIDSFAKYYLLSEFTANTEAYTANFFFYKDGTEDLLHAGPGWDYDLAFHDSPTREKVAEQNIILGQNFDITPTNYSLENTVKQNSTDADAQRITNILYDLMDIPEFQTRVKEIYQSTLSGHGDELLEYIRSQAEYIRPAALRDAKRWKLKTNFDDEVNYLIDWVAKRYSHFEQTYGTASNTSSSASSNASPNTPSDTTPNNQKTTPLGAEVTGPTATDRANLDY